MAALTSTFGDWLAHAITTAVATAVRAALDASAQERQQIRGKLARAVTILALRDASARAIPAGMIPQAVRAARKAADDAFSAAMHAANGGKGSPPRHSNPYRHTARRAARRAGHADAAQLVMDAMPGRILTGTRSLRERLAPLHAAAAITPAAKNRAWVHLARAQAATATAAMVDKRRDRLVRKHLAVTLAAWNALTEHLDPHVLARQIRAIERLGQ